MAIRVLIGEDSYLVREAVQRLLDGRPGIEVVASCGDLPSLRAAAGRLHPDVVVTDVRMPPGGLDEGIQLAEQLRRTNPGCGVVILSQYADAGLALRLLDQGVGGRAYLLKEHLHDVDQLVAAIRAVAAGGTSVDPQVLEQLVRIRRGHGRSPLEELTPRERDVLAHMAQGKSNTAIATAMVIAENSVQKYITSIFAKLGVAWESDVDRRVRAVLMYLAERSPPQN